MPREHIVELTLGLLMLVTTLVGRWTASALDDEGTR